MQELQHKHEAMQNYTAVHTGPVTFREPDPHKACNRHR